MPTLRFRVFIIIVVCRCKALIACSVPRKRGCLMDAIPVTGFGDRGYAQYTRHRCHVRRTPTAVRVRALRQRGISTTAWTVHGAEEHERNHASRDAGGRVRPGSAGSSRTRCPLSMSQQANSVVPRAEPTIEATERCNRVFLPQGRAGSCALDRRGTAGHGGARSGTAVPFIEGMADRASMPVAASLHSSISGRTQLMPIRQSGSQRSSGGSLRRPWSLSR